MGKHQDDLGRLSYTCGIDEAGRGPLAGPVTAAAVILPPDALLTGGSLFEGLADSKKLTEVERLRLEVLIRRHAWFGYGWANNREIDELNIHHATLLAMSRAVRGLLRRTDLPGAMGNAGTIEAVVDGKFCPELPLPCTALVAADDRVPEVMAASILAKCARDRFMIAYDRVAPGYAFATHKGYPTLQHRRLIARLGVCAIHRLSFRLIPSPLSPPAPPGENDPDPLDIR